MNKIYNKDGSVETLIKKEKLDNVLSKYMEDNVDKENFKDTEIFLTSNKNLFTKQYDKNELLYIWYVVKTELYDRIFSVFPDRKNDFMFAIKTNMMKLSVQYSIDLQKIIKTYYPNYLKPDSMKIYTTQYIIDLYNYLLENDKEMKIIENDLMILLEKHRKGKLI